MRNTLTSSIPQRNKTNFLKKLFFLIAIITVLFSFFVLFKYENECYFFLSEISKTGSTNSSLILRQYKLDFMAGILETKAMNPKLTQNEIAKQLAYSSATVKRYRSDIIMPSPYRIQSNTTKRK